MEDQTLTQKLSYWFWFIAFVFSTTFALFKLAAILGFGLWGIATTSTWVWMAIGILCAGLAFLELRRVHELGQRQMLDADHVPALVESAPEIPDFNKSKQRLEIWK